MDLPELSGWRVLVIGLGMSGRSAAAWCAERGADVLAVDERPASELAGLEDIAGVPGIEIATGAPLPDRAGFDLVVPSPGVPPERYAHGARRIWGDVELAARALQVPLVAVTGTNGKSTTVRLIEAMLRAAGLRARAAGNIGEPVLSLVSEPLDVAVLEVSSFQLESVDAFRPRVAVVLNISPDHLDRHGRLEDYVAAKARILARQEPDDVAILNADDPTVRALASQTRARVLYTSRRGPVESGVFLDGGRARVGAGKNFGRAGKKSPAESLSIDLLSLPGLPGVHNLENVLAALATVHALGVDLERAATALLHFESLPHRCQQVASFRGLSFVDDSKATNPRAAQRSLESFARVLWIAGGRSKQTELVALAASAARSVLHAFLIGEAAGEIERALPDSIPVTHCESIEEAVELAAGRGQPGDVVLLAPACASYDQFSSFEERGRRFAQAALRWTSRGGPQ